MPANLRVASAVLLLAIFVLGPFFLFGPALDKQVACTMGTPQFATALAGGTLLALDIVLPIPSSLVATTMGAKLGGWSGALVNALGLTAGCLLGLKIGHSGSPLAGRILGPALHASFMDWVERHGVAAVLLCRAVPVLAEASILAAGAAKGRTVPLIAAAAFADICLGIVYAFAGASRGSGAAPSAPALAAAVGIPALAAVVALVWIRSRPSG